MGLRQRPALLIGMNLLRQFGRVSIDYGLQELRFDLAAYSSPETVDYNGRLAKPQPQSANTCQSRRSCAHAQSHCPPHVRNRRKYEPRAAPLRPLERVQAAKTAFTFLTSWERRPAINGFVGVRFSSARTAVDTMRPASRIPRCRDIAIVQPHGRCWPLGPCLSSLPEPSCSSSAYSKVAYRTTRGYLLAYGSLARSASVRLNSTSAGLVNVIRWQPTAL